MYKIYGLKVITEDKVRYVGYTKRTLNARLSSHFNDAKQGMTYKKCQWIKKHNFNIEIILLEDNLTYEEALVQEKYWVNKLDTLKTGMNMTEGGDANPMNNPETIAKHKLNNVPPPPRFGEDNWMTSEEGKNWIKNNNPMNNPEAKEKHKQSMIKRRIVVDENKLKQYYIDENKTLNECAILLDVSFHSIVRNLKRFNIKKYK